MTEEPRRPADEEGDDPVPETHPRHDSLVTRERVVAGVEMGITSEAGLVAQGRGEAFDYLLGERTIESAARAERAAAALLLGADHPVISVNGNVAALVPEEVGVLARATGADVEVNLFHRTEERIERIAAHLRDHGVDEVKGLAGDATIPGLDHGRGRVDSDGIAAADVVLVPLEDGDRAAALAAAGKSEVVVDLNPLSRSAEAAAVPVIDNVVRAIPAMAGHAESLAERSDAELARVVERFDPDAARSDAERAIRSGELGGGS
ncbi:MAG: 4-phosphopantoate--beta-alanine ligase [Haloferacaceae archaeon]